MNGTAKRLIDKLFAEKAKGDKVIVGGLRVKLILKGIPVDKLTVEMPDDTILIGKIKTVLQEYGVSA